MSTTFRNLGGLLALSAILYSTALSAQPLEVSNAAPFTPENLISNIFLGDGVEVVDIQFLGNASAVAFFNNGEDEIGIQRGVAMSTGAATSVGGNVGIDQAGMMFSSEGTSGTSLDPDLQAITDGQPINDLVGYVITFIPTSDTLRFDYVFASEEYPEYACSQYNDVFGFFISGPGINGPFSNDAENIALIPGTNLPVTINNVNPGTPGSQGNTANCTPPLGSLSFANFFNDNDGSTVGPVYDGFTDVFTAQAVVEPCQTYTIKLVVADVFDGGWDSGVFLEAKSFGTGSVSAEAATASLDGSIAEGCTPASLVFELPGPASEDVPLDFTLFGEAEEGVDYNEIPDDLFIPAGDSILTIDLFAFEDNLVEGTEVLYLDIQRDPCNRDTIPIFIQDYRLVEIDLGPDTTVCPGARVRLDGELPVDVPEPPSFTNSNPLLIPDVPSGIPLFRDIDVGGVLPPNLQPGVIRSVCIDSLEHRWIDDLDIFLFSPGGQFIELSTDNGADGGNGLAMDNMIGTCFTPTATDLITDITPADMPFTGEYQPEGIWDDLYGEGRPTNGTWTLQITDDAFNVGGNLFSWTITFNPVYDIFYSWSPAEGLSCTDCPSPMAVVDSTTTYTLTVTDAYGCQEVQSITIATFDALPAPELSCDNVTESSVTVSWEDVPGANGYEVNVDSTNWEPANGNNSHTVINLANATTVHFQVRAIGLCDGQVDTISCTTLSCISADINVLNMTDVSCFGGSNGSLLAEASGGQPPYEFVLNGDQNTSGQFNNLPAGTFDLVVVDADNCAGVQEVTIGQPDSLAIDFQVADISCPGAADGEIAPLVQGGFPPFAYSWADGTTDSLRTGLPAGTYSLQLEDAQGCSFSYDIELTAPEPIVAAVAVTEPLCGGEPTGGLQLEATGGAAPYTYLLETGATNTDGAFANLTAGAYSYTVTDANGCQLQGDTLIAEPDVLQLQLNAQDANCFGGTNGQAAANVNGGTAPFTYDWQNAAGESAGTDSTLTDVPAGDYSLMLTDANGCTSSETTIINEPDSLQVESSTTPASCAGLADGQAELQATGGTMPYTYSWSDISDGPQTRDDLPAGEFTVTLTDANGCVDSTAVSISAPQALQLSLNADQTLCFDSEDGQAAVEVDGGTGPYAYLWSNGQQTPAADGLAPGEVSVNVTDANGCEASATVEVPAAPGIELNLNAENLSCFESGDGTATALATGGAGGFAYSWSNGSNGATAISLEAGLYIVSATDANGCTVADSINLEEPAALELSFSAEAATCLPQPDGRAAAEVTGGTAPYTYFWSDGQNGSEAVNLAGGTYSLTVTDANGCTLAESVEIDEISPISLEGSSEAVACNGGSNGSLTVLAEGGEGDYLYNWSNGSSAQPTLSGLVAGTYSLTVTDELGCESSLDLQVEEPAALSISLNINDISCSGENTGQASATVSGGTAPYSYNWSNGSEGPAVDSLGVGNYELVVTDANGCVAEENFSVEESAPIFVTAEVEAADCFGAATGAAQLAVSGGNPPYVYNWSNGAQGSMLQEVVAGDYTVTITDVTGCAVEEEFFIPQPEGPLQAELSPQPVICAGESTGSLQVLAEGGTPPYRYSLDGGEFFSGSSSFLGLDAGTYQVLVRDGNGCLFESAEAVVTEPDPLTVDLGETRAIPFGQSTTLQPLVEGGVPPYSYAWSAPDSTVLSCLDCPAPEASTSFQVTVQLTVTDAQGCEADALVTIFAEKDRPVQVATGFTPNGDNRNDRLFPQVQEGIELEVLYFRIFDRWGERVFDAENILPNVPEAGWDGSYRGELLQPGVYIWHIGILFPDGLEDDFSGQTTLIR